MATDDLKQKKEAEFLRKHRGLSESKDPQVESKSVDDILREQEEAKKDYNVDMAVVEAALTEFLEIKDPIVYNKKAIAWVRRPTMKELKTMFPNEMLELMDANKLDDLPPEEAEKYNKVLYDAMANLIVIPKHTAEEWENKSNPYFLKMFYEHIANMALILQPQVEGF